MITKKYTISEKEYTFVCETWETSRAWGHRVVLLRNGYEISEAKIRYYNRTWECYQYQCCMKKALGLAIDKHAKAIEKLYRLENNITRISKKQKDELAKLLENDELMQEYRKIYEQL